MFWYLVIFGALVAFALVERGQKWPGIAAAVILAAMCGLRYQTGFDWVEYELHYDLAPALLATDFYAGAQPIQYEPGFEFINQVLKLVGAPFELLMFLIGAFNMYVLYRFISRYSPLVAVVLLWYYGFVFLTGQMATMRQSFSVSFILLAMMQQNEGKASRAAVLSLVAVLMHSFSIVFVPLVFANRRSPAAVWLGVLALLGFLASVTIGNLFAIVAETLLRHVSLAVVADRLQMYSSQIGFSISPVGVVLAAMHIGFVGLMQRRKQDDYIARVAVWCAWLTVVLHSWFGPFPILWNRMMLVAWPLEAVAVCRAFHVPLALPLNRVRLTVPVSLGSLAALLYALLGAQSLVYEPYQNLAVTWIRGPYGTGRYRYQVVRNDNDSLLAEQKH